MSQFVAPNRDVFEIERDLVEATSNHRPDTSWKQIDTGGHLHQWFVGDKPAVGYRPTEVYHNPTLVFVKTGEEYWEDDDQPHDVGYLACKECGDMVIPGYRADDCTQYIPGLIRCRINGISVSKEEFEKHGGWFLMQSKEAKR